MCPLRNVSAGVWPRVISHCKARDVRLYHITLQSLDGTQRLSAAEKLTLEWANKIADLPRLRNGAANVAAKTK